MTIVDNKYKKLAIIGSGDLGQLIAHHASEDSKMEVVGYFNDFAAVVKFNAWAAVAKVFNQFSGGSGSSIFSIS